MIKHFHRPGGEIPPAENTSFSKAAIDNQRDPICRLAMRTDDVLPTVEDAICAEGGQGESVTCHP